MRHAIVFFVGQWLLFVSFKTPQCNVSIFVAKNFSSIINIILWKEIDYPKNLLNKFNKSQYILHKPYIAVFRCVAASSFTSETCAVKINLINLIGIYVDDAKTVIPKTLYDFCNVFLLRHLGALCVLSVEQKTHQSTHFTSILHNEFFDEKFFR